MVEIKDIDFSSRISKLATQLPFFIKAPDPQSGSSENNGDRDENCNICTDNEVEADNVEEDNFDRALKYLGFTFRIQRQAERKFDYLIDELLVSIARDFSYKTDNNSYSNALNEWYNRIGEFTNNTNSTIQKYIDTIANEIESQNLTIPLFGHNVMTAELAQSYAILAFLILIRAGQTRILLEPQEKDSRKTRLAETYRIFTEEGKRDNSLRDKLRLPKKPSYVQLEIFNTVFTMPGAGSSKPNQFRSLRNLTPISQIRDRWRSALVRTNIFGAENDFHSLYSHNLTYDEISRMCDILSNQQILLQGIEGDTRNWIYKYRYHKVGDYGEGYYPQAHANIVRKHLKNIPFDFEPILNGEGKSQYELVSGIIRLLLSVGIAYETALSNLCSGQIDYDMFSTVLDDFFSLLFIRNIKQTKYISAIEDDEKKQLNQTFVHNQSFVEAILGRQIIIFYYHALLVALNSSLSRYTPQEALKRMLSKDT